MANFHQRNEANLIALPRDGQMKSGEGRARRTRGEACLHVEGELGSHDPLELDDSDAAIDAGVDQQPPLSQRDEVWLRHVYPRVLPLDIIYKSGSTRGSVRTAARYLPRALLRFESFGWPN